MGPVPGFHPGFRLSAFDVIVLIGGSIGSYAAWLQLWWFGFVIAFVMAHFFLFCNVFRRSRPLEMIWSLVSCGLAGSTIILGIPGWMLTVAMSLCLTTILIFLEMRKPSYHGIFWKVMNPDLSIWWESNVANH